eukprot:4997815-Prymnesium_polylepis.1
MCPQACSEHGDCRPDGTCNCWTGWGGAACANATCPAAHTGRVPPNASLLWSRERPDEPGCGPHGVCNTTSRVCVCEAGWGVRRRVGQPNPPRPRPASD